MFQQIHATEREYEVASSLLGVGVDYAQISNAAYTRVLFLLSRVMVSYYILQNTIIGSKENVDVPFSCHLFYIIGLSTNICLKKLQLILLCYNPCDRMVIQPL